MGDVFDALQMDGYFDPHVVSFDGITPDTTVQWKGKKYEVIQTAPDSSGYWLRDPDNLGGSATFVGLRALEEANPDKVVTISYTISHAPTARWPTEATYKRTNCQVRRK